MASSHGNPSLAPRLNPALPGQPARLTTGGVVNTARPGALGLDDIARAPQAIWRIGYLASHARLLGALETLGPADTREVAHVRHQQGRDGDRTVWLLIVLE